MEGDGTMTEPDYFTQAKPPPRNDGEHLLSKETWEKVEAARAALQEKRNS